MEKFYLSIEINPKYQFAFNGLGNLFSDQKKYKNAIKNY